MKQIPIRLGPVALLLTVISICLTVMTLLTFSTSGADQAMAQTFADSTQIRYSLEAEGQQFLRDADAALADGGELSDLPDTKPSGRGVQKVFEQEGYRLTVGIRPAADGGVTVTRWSLDKKWEEKSTIDGLWQP